MRRRGRRGIVLYEEPVKLASYEIGGGRLLEDDVDDIISIPGAGAAEEDLLIEVVLVAVEEEPLVAVEEPAGEGAG